MQLLRKEKPAACTMETSHHPWEPTGRQTPSDYAATPAACGQSGGAGKTQAPRAEQPSVTQDQAGAQQLLLGTPGLGATRGRVSHNH